MPPSKKSLDQEKLFDQWFISLRDNLAPQYAPGNLVRDRPYEELARQERVIRNEYQDRCLLELVQNGYDAHPEHGSEGEVQIHFRPGNVDHPDDHGSLYVANRGSGFTQDNLEGVLSLGMSSKSPGQGIGNKGLGFRSVLQICDAPLIYSQISSSLSHNKFRGFCFRFATETDFRKRFPDHEHLPFEKLPQFRAPVALSDQDTIIRGFAVLGFATVIELPLTSKMAATSVTRQIESITASDVPMHIFLPRISTLRLTIGDTPEADPEPSIFTRKLTGSNDFGLVTLQDGSSYLWGYARIPEAGMKAAIEDAIKANTMDEYWRAWEGDGEVSIAVPLGSTPAEPRLFTYLPLGAGAKTPFHGLLHGSFFPNVSRTSLSLPNALNEMLLPHSARLAARMLRDLTKTEGACTDVQALPQNTRAQAAIDLLCWHAIDGAEDLFQVLQQELVTLFNCESWRDAPVIPTSLRTSNGRLTLHFSPLTKTRKWAHGIGPFALAKTLEIAPTLGFLPLWSDLGDREQRLLKTLTSEDFSGLNLSEGERAEIVVMTAKALSVEKPGIDIRSAYYLELSDFMEEELETLAGRPVLLAADGTVMNANSQGEKSSPRRVARATFSPPNQEKDDDNQVRDQVPAGLRTRFDLLDPDLDWHNELADVRRLLEDSKLVSVYDSREVLRHLALLQRTGSKKIQLAALQFAFIIWKRLKKTGSGLDLATFPFRTPCVSGTYHRATECFFSRHWSKDKLGKLVEMLIDEVGELSPNINALADFRIASPGTAPFDDTATDDWHDFLRALGVHSGLWPQRRGNTRAKQNKDQISSLSLDSSHNLSEALLENWRGLVNEHPPNLFFRDSYLFAKGIWCLPGQVSHADFSSRAKDIYAELVLAGSPNWPEGVWETEIKLSEKNQTWTFPSPTASFVRTANWVVLEDLAGIRVEENPSVIWLDQSDEQGMPRLPEVLSIPLKRHLKGMDEETKLRLVNHAGFRTYNEPDSLGAQLHYLSWGLEMAEEYGQSSMAASLSKAYLNSWENLADNLEKIGDPLNWDHGLVYIRNGEKRATRDLSEDSGVPIHLVEPQERLIGQVLKTLGTPILDVPQNRAEVILRFLEQAHPGQFDRPTIAQFELNADDRPIGESNTRHLAELVPGFDILVAAALQKLDPMVANTLPQDLSKVIARLSPIRVQTAKNMTIKSVEQDICFNKEGAVYRLEDDAGMPVILVLTKRPDSGLTLLRESLEQICQEIKLPSLEPWLWRLVDHFQHPDNSDLLRDTPTLEECARIMRLDERAVILAQGSLVNGLEMALPWLRALVWMAGHDLQEKLDDLPSTLDEISLKEIVAPVAKALKLEPFTIQDAARNEGTADRFRTRLSLEFVAFNNALEATGGDLIDLSEDHQLELNSFIKAHDAIIKNSLRHAALDVLKKMLPCPAYLEDCAQMSSITTDPSWERLYGRLPKEAMSCHVDNWLAKHGAPPLGKATSMPSLADIRQNNAKALTKVASEAPALIKAWGLKFGKAVPALWKSPTITDDLRMRLEAEGVFPCLSLDTQDVILWCHVLGFWPTDMATSLSPEDHNLNESDLETEQQKSIQMKQEKARNARLVPFAETDLDPEDTLPEDLLTLVRNVLPGSILKMSIHRKQNLDKYGQDPNSDHPRKGTGSNNATSGRMPEAKSQLIGMIGEIIVYHWLVEHYPDQDIQSAWKSGIGHEVLQYGTANDGLGYDFEVQEKQKRLQIEVKTSLGGRGAFHFTESEMRAAQRAAKRTSGVDYRIVYVTGIEDMETLCIDVLPNPLSADGADRYRILGKGMRLKPNFAAFT